MAALNRSIMQLQHKSLPILAFKTLNAAEGIIEAVVSVFSNIDGANERVLPGAFAKSLKRKLPKGVWMHDWASPVAKTVEAEELLPGDARLPEEIRHLGGLYVKGQFNLGTQRGADAFSDLTFGTVDEFSIGYLVTEDKKDAKGVRDLVTLDLYEWSPVLVGCNDATALIGTKNQRAKHAMPNTLPETKTVTLGGVEVKATYLGEYVESEMTCTALRTLTNALFYNVFYDAVYGSWDFDGDDGYTRTTMTPDEGAAVIKAACAELGELGAATYTALMSLSASDNGEKARAAAKTLRTVFDDPALVQAELKALADADLTQDDLDLAGPALLAGVKVATLSGRALAGTQELTTRLAALKTLRVKEGRTLSTATRDRLTTHLAALKEACQGIDALLEDGEPEPEEKANQDAARAAYGRYLASNFAASDLSL